MAKAKTEKPTIGCRIESDEMKQIDAIIQETGQSRSGWLHQLVLEALGKDAETVRSLAARVTALERKLSRLAN